MFKHRFRYLLIVPLLLAALWFAWPSSPEPDDSSSNPSSSAARPSSRATPPTETDPAGNTRPPRIREHNPSETSETSVQVSRVLADDNISGVNAAVILHRLAADASLPVADRLEALQHGLNLDMAPFARFAEAPDLPVELASAFLNAVINFNESPELQIQAYLALLNHPDAEVSESATEMLAFIVEDDQREASPAKLVQMANQKLAELRKPPPVTH